MTDAYINPFDPKVTRTHFDCGKRPLTQWFRNDSAKYVKRLEMRVFTAHTAAHPRAIGYYALQLGNEHMDALESKPDDYTKNRTAFPAVHLAYIAVHGPHQRNGIGRLMMTDVFDRVYAIARHAGLYALTLQSYDTESTAFYNALGFSRYGGSDASPKMLMPVRTIVDLIEGS